MTRWLPYTFVRIVLFFTGGILLGIYFPAWPGLKAASYTLLALVPVYGLLKLYQRKVNRLFDPGFAGLAIFVLAGYVHSGLKKESIQKDHLLQVSDTVSYYQVVMVSFPEEKEHSWKGLGEVRKIRTGNGWRKCSGKVLLYFSKEDAPVPYRYGDVFIITGQPAVVDAPANPHVFNYRQFLSYRNIYHRQFLQPDRVLFVGNDPPDFFTDKAMKMRALAQAGLKAHIPGKKERAIASALVLGITDGLDNELTGAYAASGAMHVLAVSGLHVGIIYWLVFIVIRPLNRWRAGAWGIAFISIGVLWCYAFVTGLSPSVLRAVTMFTFVALAKPWGRHTHIYNTLAASAFCLLLYDPYLIMAVGFQLSYAAVAGIVYFYPRLHLLWAPSSWLASMAWKITCVSVAAQLATFPLGLLYFHQFPLYFFLSNLFIIPLAFLALVLGLLLAAVGFMPAVAAGVGAAATAVIKTLNTGVFMIESLPYSLVENVYITPFQCALLMAMVAVFILLLELKKFTIAYWAPVLALLFAAAQWLHYERDVNKQQLTVYSLYGQAAMELMDCGNAYFFADSSVHSDAASLHFTIIPNRVAAGINRVLAGDEQPFVRTFSECRLIVWNDRKILQILGKDFNVAGTVAVDYLIVSHNAVRRVDELADSIQFGKLVIDSSNAPYVADDLLQQAQRMGRPCYSVPHSGAFQTLI